MVQEAQYVFPYHYLSLASELHARILHRHYLSEIQRIITLAGPVRGMRWLDYGCGDGRLIHELRGLGVTCVGVDHSERALAFARIFDPHGTFFHAGAAEYGVTPYDRITAVQVLEHVPPPRVPALVREIAGLLGEGGRAIISAPSTRLPLTSKHYRHFDAAALEEVLSPHLCVDSIEGHVAVRAWRRYAKMQTLCFMVWPLKDKLGLVRRFVERAERYFDRHVRCDPEEACTLIATARRRR